MRSNIINRVLAEANYILETGKTIREIAVYFNVSKSTVHKDLHERLLDIDLDKFNRVDKVLKYHIDVRHLRGGESTKQKYKKEK